MRIITNVENADELKNMNVRQNASFQHHEHEGVNEKTLIVGNDPESLQKAKSRFIFAVSQTISNLMTKSGYSRKRATTLILKKIRGKNKTPSVEKVRKKCFSINVDN